MITSQIPYGPYLSEKSTGRHYPPGGNHECAVQLAASRMQEVRAGR